MIVIVELVEPREHQALSATSERSKCRFPPARLPHAGGKRSSGSRAELVHAIERRPVCLALLDALPVQRKVDHRNDDFRTDSLLPLFGQKGQQVGLRAIIWFSDAADLLKGFVVVPVERDVQ